MGNLDTALGPDAAQMVQDFGETWSYTPAPVGGVFQASQTVQVIVDRHQPQLAREGPLRVRRVTLFVPNNAIGLTPPNAPNLGDSFIGPWQLSDASPSTFRVVAIISQDPGGWTLHADVAQS